MFSLIAGILGCDGSSRLLGASDQPVVYLVLSAEPVGADSTLYALVAGGADEALLRYADVSEFSMRRVSDGAQYDWQVLPHAGRLPLTGRGLSEVANVRLRWTGTGTNLGRRDLVGNDAYDLAIVADGKMISGRAILPPGIAITVEGSGPGAVARWTRASPRDVYLVLVSVDDPSGLTTRDSSYTIKANLPPEAWIYPTISVVAVDSSYLAYQRDTLLTTYGLSGAKGVFVGVARSSATLDMGEPTTQVFPIRGERKPNCVVGKCWLNWRPVLP